MYRLLLFSIFGCCLDVFFCVAPVLLAKNKYSSSTTATVAKKWSHILLSQTNLPGLCRHLVHLIWIWHINISITPSTLRRKSVSHMADKMIVYHVGMPGVKTSTKHSCNTLKGINLAELLELCFPSLTGNGGIDGLRLSRTSTFHTLSG